MDTHVSQEHRRATSHADAATGAAGEDPHSLASLSRQLYGREAETRLLHAELAASANGVRCVLLTGPSGIGKTALARSVACTVRSLHGRFACGKFDQYLRSLPLSAAAQATTQLFELLASEGGERLATARERVHAALGDRAQIVAAVLPAAGALAAPPAAGATADIGQTSARLLPALADMVTALATPQEPLALLLDDLQWADDASLRFIETLLLDSAGRGLLVVGTCRDEALSSGHPLQRWLDKLDRAGRAPRRVPVPALSVQTVQALLHDIGLTQADPPSHERLAAQVHEATDGNPYHVTELLKSLPRDPAAALPERPTAAASDDEAALQRLLERRVRTLASRDQRVLALAASLGSVFDVGLLQDVAQHSVAAARDEVEQALHSLQDAGLLSSTDLPAPAAPQPPRRMSFVHDSIQQAARGLVTAGQRQQLHLDVARLLGRGEGADPTERATHLAEAVHLLRQPQERAAAAQCFREASARARAATSFEMAAHFLSLARSLRPPGSWEADFDGSFADELAWHAALHAAGRGEEARAVYEHLSSVATDPFALADAACLQMSYLIGTNRLQDASDLGGALLQRMGLPIPHERLEEAANEELERFYRLMYEQGLQRLAPSPPAPYRIGALVRVLGMVTRVGFYHHQPLAQWATLTTSRLWVEHGYAEAMLQSLACLLPITARMRDDYATGYRVVNHMVSIARAHASELVMGTVELVWSGIALHYFRPLEDCIHMVNQARAKLHRSAAVMDVAFSYVTSETAMLDVAAHIDQAEDEIQHGLTFAVRTGNIVVETVSRELLTFVQRLRGSAGAPGRDCPSRFGMTIGVHHTYAALGALVFNDPQELRRRTDRLVPLLPQFASIHAAAVAKFTICWSVLAQLEAAGTAERPELLRWLERHLRWLQERAQDAPANLGHLYTLVCARRADIEGRPWDAAELYDQAARSAAEHARAWHHALALEQAARFYLRRGIQRTARELMRAAIERYRAWGASGKAAALERDAGFAPLEALPDALSTPSWNSLDADRQAILLASQAISSETEPPRLAARILEVIMQLSGATSACLLAPNEAQEWGIVRQAGMGGDFPAALVRHAVRHFQPETIHDLGQDARFAAEGAPASGPRSVLIMPVFAKETARAVLLLENTLAPGFFTDRHIDTLRLIAGQLSISLENAQLYRSLERRVAQRTAELERLATDLMLRDRALDACANGVLIVELKPPLHPVIYVNPMLEELTGYTAADLIGDSAMRLVGRDTAQPTLAELQLALREQRSGQGLLRCYRKDGSMFWSEVSIAPVRATGTRITHYVLIHVDVTERIRAEEASRLKTHRLRAVFELSPDGFVALDEHGRVSIVNPAFESMTGLKAATLLGVRQETFERRLAALCVDSDDADRPAFADTSPMKEPSLPDRSLIRIGPPLSRTLLRRVRHGDVGQETVMYFRDVTREEEVDRMKSEFLSTAAHELRTPMTSIYGFSDLLAQGELPAEEQREVLGIIHRQSSGMVDLINELLDLARIDARRGSDFKLRRLPLQAVVNDTIGGLLVPNDSRRVVVHMPHAPVLVNIDGDKLALALTNVLSNAYKYSSLGPIELSVRQREHHGRWQAGVTVRDHGIGMTPTQIRRMFERFYRANPSDGVQGTGLGATIFKEIVEAHGGTVEVASIYGEGTTVTLWLPAEAA